MVAGKEAVNHGEAKNSWLTGTAAWTFVAMSQYLLGVRPTLDGLVIDPKIDEEMEITRLYKGHRVHIKLKAGKHNKVILTNQELEKEGEDIYVEL